MLLLLSLVLLAKPAVPAGKQPIQSTTIMTAANPGTTFSYGGFIKMDAMATDTSDGRIADGSSGRLFYVPSTIPVAGAGADGGDPYADFHAQFSRFWLSADHVTDSGDKFKGFVEMDFFGGGSNALAGNETATNTYAVTLRHAYVSWNNWLAGQTWSNFQDVAALPDAVDFVGVTDHSDNARLPIALPDFDNCTNGNPLGCLLSDPERLTDNLRKNLTVDWTERESVQAKLRLMVKRILRKYKYPPDQQDAAVELVLQQAEVLGDSWSG